MIKIDHSARAEDVSPPVPSLAILADQLLELEERQRARFSEEDGGLSRIKTGCLEIDNYVLCGGKNESDGGFERGVVVGLSAADGDESLGGRLVGFYPQCCVFNCVLNGILMGAFARFLSTLLPPFSSNMSTL